MSDGRHTFIDMMGTTMSKLREMIDVDTIVGKPIITGDGSTVIPVSKVGFGFSSAGSEFGKEKSNFGGGSGAGVSINPVAFLIISRGNVRLMPVSQPAGSAVDRIVEAVPSIIEKIDDIVKKNKSEQ